MRAVHKRRLLKAADVVEKAKNYDQMTYFHSCGSPACVLGHYAAATRYRVFKKGSWFFPDGTLEDAAEHFGLAYLEAEDLFGSLGCGRARTGKQAAAYIRKFVKRKEAEVS